MRLLFILTMSLSLSLLASSVDGQIKKEFNEEFIQFNAKTIEVQKNHANERYEKIQKFEKSLHEDRLVMLETVAKKLKELEFGNVKQNKEVRGLIAQSRKNFQKEVGLKRKEFKEGLKKFMSEHRKQQKARWIEFRKKIKVRREELSK